MSGLISMMKTTPTDKRFPTVNQGNHCWCVVVAACRRCCGEGWSRPTTVSIAKEPHDAVFTRTTPRRKTLKHIDIDACRCGHESTRGGRGMRPGQERRGGACFPLTSEAARTRLLFATNKRGERMASPAPCYARPVCDPFALFRLLCCRGGCLLSRIWSFVCMLGSLCLLCCYVGAPVRQGALQRVGALPQEDRQR
jgi:hypothetical protein